MANRLEWVFCAFATALVGGVLVPVNTFARSAERDVILRHSDASLLLMQPSLLGRDLRRELLETQSQLAEGAPGRLRCTDLPQLRQIACLGSEQPARGIETWDSLLARGADVSDSLLDAATEEVHPSDDGLIIYTSGTSARPKGVVHFQRTPVIQSYRLADYMRLRPTDRVFTAQPFFWTAGIVWSLGATLAAGGRMLLQETFQPAEALDLIESQRATVLHAWSHQEKVLAEHESIAERDLSSVEKIEFNSLLAPVVGLRRTAGAPTPPMGRPRHSRWPQCCRLTLRPSCATAPTDARYPAYRSGSSIRKPESPSDQTSRERLPSRASP